MTSLSELADAVEGTLTKAQLSALMLLGPEFQPAPRSISRQATAALAMKRPDLCEREWQDGCAQCTYYRLTPLGMALRARASGEGA